MATHKATPTIIPPQALHSLLRKVIQQLRPNLRLRLPNDPEGSGIWKYYDNIRVYPVLTDNMLVILLTIPILDTTLELNIYRVHNLPAIPPGHQLAATYQLEGEYKFRRGQTWSVRSIAPPCHSREVHKLKFGHLPNGPSILPG